MITDVPGVTVGHHTDLDGVTGCTVILLPPGTRASCAIVGSAPGTRETDALRPESVVNEIQAILLTGGSSFGLGATDGVMSWLREKERGLAMRDLIVPIVPTAVIFDIAIGEGLAYPRADDARAACEGAGSEVAEGSVGAGTGATTATVKGGLGSASALSSQGHRIAAIVAVNALGSATIGEGPHFWAAPFEIGQEFGGLGMPKTIDTRLRLKGTNVTATTIGAIVTDAALTKAEAHRLSICGHDGLARALLPTHLPLDGDTVFAASTTKHKRDDLQSFMELCHLATIVMARAIARGVYEATALPIEGTQPSWRDRFQDRMI